MECYFSGITPQSTPIAIKHNGEYVRSPKILANISNQFYIDKVAKITGPLSAKNKDPISLLNKLIPPKNCNSFTLPEINISETYKLIRNMKNSNSVGYDSISINTIKNRFIHSSPEFTHDK